GPRAARDGGDARGDEDDREGRAAHRRRTSTIYGRWITTLSMGAGSADARLTLAITRYSTPTHGRRASALNLSHADISLMASFTAFGDDWRLAVPEGA